MLKAKLDQWFITNSIGQAMIFFFHFQMDKQKIVRGIEHRDKIFMGFNDG